MTINTNIFPYVKETPILVLTNQVNSMIKHIALHTGEISGAYLNPLTIRATNKW